MRVLLCCLAIAVATPALAQEEDPFFNEERCYQIFQARSRARVWSGVLATIGTGGGVLGGGAAAVQSNNQRKEQESYIEKASQAADSNAIQALEKPELKAPVAPWIASAVALAASAGAAGMVAAVSAHTEEYQQFCNESFLEPPESTGGATARLRRHYIVPLFAVTFKFGRHR